MVTLHPDHMVFHDLLQLFEKEGHRMNVRLQTRFFIPALKLVERGLGICVMDPISIASYCSYAQPGKIVFRRMDQEIFIKFAIMFPSDTPRSMITNEFAALLRERILQLQDHPENLLSWGSSDFKEEWAL